MDIILSSGALSTFSRIFRLLINPQNPNLFFIEIISKVVIIDRKAKNMRAFNFYPFKQTVFCRRVIKKNILVNRTLIIGILNVNLQKGIKVINQKTIIV